jgi:hypothetical protein
MAAAFLPADRLALEQGARLVDQFAAGDLSVRAELRHLEDRFGLSPMARQRLRWQLDEQTERVHDRERRPRPDRRLKAVR